MQTLVLLLFLTNALLQFLHRPSHSPIIIHPLLPLSRLSEVVGRAVSPGVLGLDAADLLLGPLDGGGEDIIDIGVVLRLGPLLPLLHDGLDEALLFGEVPLDLLPLLLRHFKSNSIISILLL